MKGTPLVILSFDSWGPVQSRKHHLARSLAASGAFSDVIYVTPPEGGEGPRTTGTTTRGLTVCTPRSPSATEGKFPLTRASLRDITAQIAEIIAGKGDRETVVWCQSPFYAEVALSLGRSLLAVDLTDRYELLFPDCGRVVRESLQRILGEADVVFGVSRKILEVYEDLIEAPFSMVLPNGVDVDFFDPEHTEASKEILASIPRPRFGYVGRLCGRIDRGLVEGTALMMPEAHFVFAGPLLTDHRWLQDLPNCHLPGAVEYRQVPSCIAAFDTCLLPHRRDGDTSTVDPVKLYEYIAMGKPVVASPVPGTERFPESILLGSTPEEFTAACRRSTDGPSAARAAGERGSIIEGHDWSLRAADALDLLRRAAGETHAF